MFPFCLSSLLSYSSSLTETMPTKFKGSGKSWFGGSEKDFYFCKITKSQHKLVWECKQGN